jgi:hypothetical protein
MPVYFVQTRRIVVSPLVTFPIDTNTAIGESIEEQESSPKPIELGDRSTAEMRKHLTKLNTGSLY